MGIWTNLNRLIDSKKDLEVIPRWGESYLSCTASLIIGPDKVRGVGQVNEQLLLRRQGGWWKIQKENLREKNWVWDDHLWSCSAAPADQTEQVMMQEFDSGQQINFECVATIHYIFCCFLNHYEASYTATEHLNHLVICQAPNHFNLKGVDTRR